MEKTRWQKTRSAVGAVSLLLFPASFYYLSPVISLGGASLGILAGSLIVFGVLLVSGMLLGRSFCSWVCPAGKIQDLAMQSRTGRFPRKALAWLKYVVWAAWLGLLFILFHSSGGIKRVDFTFATTSGFSVGDLPSLIAYLAVVLAFFGLALIGGRRTGCHTICWMAPFLVLGMKLGDLLRLKRPRLAVVETPCSSCGLCDRQCPMSLEVSKFAAQGKPESADCILCGACVDACPRKRLCLKWKNHA